MSIGFLACGFMPGGPRDPGRCIDAGGLRDAVPPSVGDLVITEVMAKPKHLSATVAQWFEVVARTDLDLNGVYLHRANAANIEPEVVAAEECLHLPAGSYAVFARSEDAAQNGNLVASGVFSFSLNPDGEPDVQVVTDDEVIDRVTWSGSTSGTSLQLDPGKIDAVANDEPESFCDATTVYELAGGNKGSPGAANPPCPTRVEAGECRDGAVVRPIASPRSGQLVITEFLANPSGSGSDAMQEWFEVANIGSTAFDLNNLTVASGTRNSVVVSTDCIPVLPGGFALFAHSTDPTINGGLSPVAATFSFALANRNGSLSVSDENAVLDQIAWTGSPQSDGIARQLKPTHMNVVDNDVEANFCAAGPGNTYGRDGNLGTPGASNVCTPSVVDYGAADASVAPYDADDDRRGY